MMRLFFSRIYRKGLLNWNGKKYPHDVESDVSSGCWYNFVRDLGVDDEKMNDGNMIKGNSFDTSIKEHKSRRELDLHVMEEGPINLPWPRERKENQEETGYHSVHKFNPLEKAQADSNCGKAEQDIHGNWVPIFTPT
tara:strand:+ start:63 stop:473 length:411 start_codon:yes stop_codon:yes gene_type:complete